MTTPEEKVSPIAAPVGSQEWIRCVQDCILDSRSICFVCSGDITFKKDFFYMSGRMGIIMMHDDCFTPVGSRSKPARTQNSVPAQRRNIMPNGQGALDPQEWMSLTDAASLIGISYSALYQRFWANGEFRNNGEFEKREGVWYMKRAAALAMPRGKQAPGRKPFIPRRSRMWRSEVTESPERVSVGQAARMIGASRSWVLARRDQFGAVKLNGSWLVSKTMVEEFIQKEQEEYAA